MHSTTPQTERPDVKYPSPSYRATTARIAAGICGVPSVHKTKAPSFLTDAGETVLLKWKHLTTRTLTPVELSNYFDSTAQARTDTGCGVLLGAFSLVEREGVLHAPVCLDFDDMATWQAFEQACERYGLGELVERALRERSPRGMHLAGLVNGMYPTKNLALYDDGHGKRRPLIELKTRFVKTAPSPHYTALHGDWTDLPLFTTEEWEQLIALAMTFHRVADKPVDYRAPYHTAIAAQAAPCKGCGTTIKQVNQYRFTSLTSLTATQPLSQTDLVALTHRPDVVERLAVFLGLPPPSLGKNFACILAGHGPDNTPSMTWLPPRSTAETWKVCCHHGDSLTLSLVELYYWQRTGTWTKLNKSSFGVWQSELLIEAGIIPRPTPLLRPLPHGVSAHARQAYEAIAHLYSTRMLRNDAGHSLPLVHRFVATFHGDGLTEYGFRKGLHVLLRRAVLQAEGKDDRGEMLFSPYVRSRVRRKITRAPLPPTQHQTETIAAVAVVKAQVASEAAPLRRQGQKEGYPAEDAGGIAVAEYDDSGFGCDDVAGMGPWEIP